MIGLYNKETKLVSSMIQAYDEKKGCEYLYNAIVELGKTIPAEKVSLYEEITNKSEIVKLAEFDFEKQEFINDRKTLLVLSGFKILKDEVESNV